MYRSIRKLAAPLFTAATVVAVGALLGAPAWGAEESGGGAVSAESGAAAPAGGAAPTGAVPPTEGAAPTGAVPPTEAAVWTPKEIQFTYMGFTTRYTCDGLRDTVKDMLLQLGARKDDLKVYEQPCSGPPDRPNPFPGVKIKMSVLTPAPSAPADGTQTVPAQWKTVKLPYRETAINGAGQCELLEQVKQKILPLFTTRNVDLRATCVPHQLQLGTQLQAEVLITDQKKTRQASAAEQQ